MAIKLLLTLLLDLAYPFTLCSALIIYKTAYLIIENLTRTAFQFSPIRYRFCGSTIWIFFLPAIKGLYYSKMIFLVLSQVYY
jgi:hypothetical protein